MILLLTDGRFIDDTYSERNRGLNIPSKRKEDKRNEEDSYKHPFDSASVRGLALCSRRLSLSVYLSLHNRHLYPLSLNDKYSINLAILRHELRLKTN